MASRRARRCPQPPRPRAAAQGARPREQDLEAQGRGPAVAGPRLATAAPGDVPRDPRGGRGPSL
eukprot:6953915-Pyramimonas_sp.AAC.1